MGGDPCGRPGRCGVVPCSVTHIIWRKDEVAHKGPHSSTHPPASLRRIPAVVRPDPHFVFWVPAPACLGYIEGERQMRPALCQARRRLRPTTDAADGIDRLYAT